MKVKFSNIVQRHNASHELAKSRLHLRQRGKQCNSRPNSFLEEVRNVNPKRLALHTRLLVERELFTFKIKMKTCESIGIAVKKLRCSSLHYSVESCDALLAVQQQLNGPRRLRCTAPDLNTARSNPDEQAPYGMAPVQRLHKPADLVSSPHEPTLERGKGEMVVLYIGKD